MHGDGLASPELGAVRLVSIRSTTLRAVLCFVLCGVTACTTRSDVASTPALPGDDAAAAVGIPAGDAPDQTSRGLAGGAQRPLLTASIATGNARETNFQIGRDLATVVAPDAGVALDVLATKGSADNLHRVTDEARVALAIVQYDVIQAYVNEAGRGDAAALHIVRPLRIVMPLYTEEMYFIVRNDSPMKAIQDIRGKRIAVGVQGSGSASTAAAVYRRMFRTPIAPRDARHLTDEQALAALTVDRSVDVVVAAQPARLFADMKPQARAYIRLLALDDRDPSSREALKHYFPAKILARNYPSLLTADVPTLSVMSFLVTSDRPGNPLTPRLADLARSLCANLATLRATGHPKWREVDLGQRFGTGWTYAAASEREFERCAGRSR